VTEAVNDGLGTPQDHQARFDFAPEALLDGFTQALARRSAE
jgi:hypothetical protein